MVLWVSILQNIFKNITYFRHLQLHFLLNACSTRKVPEDSYLLTSNKFQYKDGKLFEDKVPDFVNQKPNKNFFCRSYWFMGLQYG